MNGYIKIILKSDLCAASGDGFSLSIDTDVCADMSGLPFIPARRLKGCLREAAEYIGCNRIDSIFGVKGSSSGSLRINDARLEDHNLLEAQTKANGFTAGQVLQLFTSVKASTAIENGSAKENSLRFTRVVNHYSPFDGSELIFISDIEYADGDNEHLTRICKALRNIGYKLTRGYGSVKCEFVPEGRRRSISVDIPDNEKDYELRYTVRLSTRAMFVGKSSVESLDYIPGSAVLGAFAAGYLKEHNAGSEFEDLFLKNNLRFSNLYITDGATVSEPAPSVLGRLKDSREIKYVFREDNELSEPLPKAFKNAYMIGSSEIKPAKEIIYHHSVRDKVLYTQECLSEGQLFSGSVTGKGNALHKLLPILESGRINLGRSKSAQYSFCDITAVNCSEYDCKTVPAGEIYALLCSDVLLIDDNAQFTTDIKALEAALGFEADRAHSSLKYKTVMGYISVGRYKREHISAFDKGSVLCIRTDRDMPEYLTVGERQNEGFGVIRLCTKAGLMKLGRSAPKLENEKTAPIGRLADHIANINARNKLRDEAIDYAENSLERIRGIFNLAFVGRLLLMVSQAESEADLDSRIASVKNEKKRKAAEAFKQSAQIVYGTEWYEFLRTALTVIKYRLKEADE